MSKKLRKRLTVATTIIGLIMSCLPAFARETVIDTVSRRVDKAVRNLMKEGNIPGLSLFYMINGREHFRNYGLSDLDSNTPIKSNTLFEIGSCSKSFTALALMTLVKEGYIKLDNPITAYLPWFKAKYQGKERTINISQLLHHTSGIPWQSIGLIPEGSEKDALEKTVRNISGITLNNKPGLYYEYATVNYDILALIIQYVSRQSFESYLQKNVIDALGLKNTTIGKPRQAERMATGYKIGFSRPIIYKAPTYKGNNAAGYIIADIRDMSQWLKFQLGFLPNKLYTSAEKTHEPDFTVPIHDSSLYGMGWQIALNGGKDVYHGGLNPNYTAYMAFRQTAKAGVIVLANSNSSYTRVIGIRVMEIITHDLRTQETHPADNGDMGYSIIVILLSFYIFVVFILIGIVFADISRKLRAYEQPNKRKVQSVLFSLVVLIPFVFGIYLFPEGILGLPWESAIVWAPGSFLVMAFLLAGAVVLTYLTYFLTSVFPHKNKYVKILPRLLLISILSGLANMGLILLITSAINSSLEVKYLVFYFLLTVTIYLLGRKFVQINLIHLTKGVGYDLRISVFHKIFSTSYQHFEKLERGRIYTSLTDDVETVGNSTNMFVMLITSLITSIGAFLYLTTIAFWAAILTAALIAVISMIYYIVSRNTNKYYEQARDTRNVFMNLTNGMIDGFKELSLHRKKKLEYHGDVSNAAEELKKKLSTASVHFVNTFLVGEALFITLLGTVAFIIPKLFAEIHPSVIMSFIIVLLYLIGPVNRILTSVPAIMQLRIAWNRIQSFLRDIPSDLDLSVPQEPLEEVINEFSLCGVTYKYKQIDDQEIFTVGPIDIQLNRGQILFIIGGNGSGKTTLAKLITGLYEPDAGSIKINDKIVPRSILSEYFSTVFSPVHLFHKLYNMEVNGKKEALLKYLKVLNLEGKVKIEGNSYNTINLSGGQRKRLALLQCYLEDSPIYLFDEWAADQDPTYRRFFYTELLPEMKAMGKIVIAISHDDRYFSVADKIIRMEQGKLEVYAGQNSILF